jgi:dUTP pyrophosphatase
MQVRFKKLHLDAVIPSYATAGDAGLDMVAVDLSDTPEQVTYQTGIAVEIPEGHVGLLFPRSSNTKKALTLGNSVGVVDSGYRGPIILKYKPLAYAESMKPEEPYAIGDRIGQIIIIPYRNIHFLEVTELTESENKPKIKTKKNSKLFRA